MKITIVGTGYVGLVTGACLADVGISVNCVDIDEYKIDNLKDGILPIYEPGLEDIVRRNLSDNRLNFSTSLEENLNGVDALFIAVGTPPGEDGSADMKYVLSVAREIGKHLSNYCVIVTKSTVPVGSSEVIRHAIKEELKVRGIEINFDMVSNPEFLKEGAAIKDFMSPDRIVVGVDSERAKKVMDVIYKPFLLNGYRIVYMDIISAELTKYAANSMLATRISFMNEIANLCELVGADINSVRKGIGTDPRIGNKFLYAGIGYGGSCFPKDVKALINIGKSLSYNLRLLEAVEFINKDQKEVIFEKIFQYFGGNLKNKIVAVWGLSFKPNTDDMREAPSLVLIQRLLDSGAIIQATDPVANNEARKLLAPSVSLYDDVYSASENADCVVLVTEWNEFRLPDWQKIKGLMKEPILFDGRNIYDRELLENYGFYYSGIGR